MTKKQAPSERDEKWKRLLFDPKSKISSAFSSWLENRNEICFQISSDAFKHLNFKPGKMIPSYHKDQLPLALKENGLELFRNQSGGCVITKTGEKWNRPTLFPNFPECKRVMTNPFTNVNYPSLLFRNEVINEVTSFFLAQRMGVLTHFLADVHSSIATKGLDHCGRLQGTVMGTILIGDEHVGVQKAQYEIDHVLENDEVVVLVELKGQFHDTMSIHQLLLPYLFLTTLEQEREILLVYFMAEKSRMVAKSLKFRLHLIAFHEIDGILKATEYQFLKSTEYIIKIK